MTGNCRWLMLGILLMLVTPGMATSAATPTYRGKSVEQWAGMLSQPDQGMSREAFDQLTQADRSAGDVLLVLLKGGDARLRGIAAAGLEHIAPDYPASIPELTQAALDINLNVRFWALSALKKYGKQAVSALPNIVRALDTYQGKGPTLEGPDRYYADARALAAQALGSMGPGAKAALPALKKALKDPSKMVRVAAEEAIAAIEMTLQDTGR